MSYTARATEHLHTAAKFAEVAEQLPDHPLHRELDEREKLVMLAIRQVLIDTSKDQIRLAHSLVSEIDGA
jgi:tetraacyldisaccharide-1-P 4'-kinase